MDSQKVPFQSFESVDASRKLFLFQKISMIIGIVVICVFTSIGIFYFASKQINTQKKQKIPSTSIISIDEKREKLKEKLKIVLSRPPTSPYPTDDLPTLNVDLPPEGKCNGCRDAPQGAYETFPNSNEAILAQGESVTGYDKSTRKWGYTHYVIKRLLPELPINTDMIFPGGNFLQDVTKLAINQSKEYIKYDRYEKINVIHL